jgi:hypothetical protein
MYTPDFRELRHVNHHSDGDFCSNKPATQPRRREAYTSYPWFSTIYPSERSVNSLETQNCCTTDPYVSPGAHTPFPGPHVMPLLVRWFPPTSVVSFVEPSGEMTSPVRTGAGDAEIKIVIGESVIRQVKAFMVLDSRLS